MSDDDMIIRVEGLIKNYKSGEETLNILKSLSFTLPRGATAAVRGKSGCGKSTLLNILGGLDTSDAGTVEVAGMEISGMGESALTAYRGSKVGFIFQFHYLLRDFTALENVMLPAYIAGLSKKAAFEKARALVADLGLGERGHHYPSQLSGGERQRVAVARAMVNDPALVLADEPTGNLDPQHSAQVAELLYAEAERRHTSLVVVTHDEKVAGRARLQYELESGVLLEAGGNG
ncbi:MAG: ABC transporter ATP-binding protein [Treponema sp.]|jgi:lipoprotein-releasing system ATP-binding protein|nr:ABC transporter ATP-binding protein [Treponema sp.]